MIIFIALFRLSPLPLFFLRVIEPLRLFLFCVTKERKKGNRPLGTVEGLSIKA